MECIPHIEELYIRSYPLGASAGAYDRKLIDLPVTLRLQEQSFYLTYRRSLAGQWSVMCSDVQLRALRKHLTVMQVQASELDTELARVFAAVQSSCAEALDALPTHATRRDVLDALIQCGGINPLLVLDEFRFYHLTGPQVLAVRMLPGPDGALDDVIELSLVQWKEFCAVLTTLAPQGRNAMMDWVRNTLQEIRSPLSLENAA
ncbi:hypothetical protein NQT62_13750 [Limnobacter humi]|uniref:CYTH domain-containing protein n=1 Tax=Limnobacter humi TaxID=1778671 RepID=A0ABT1WJ12_9BURK|nr:hypothetical protein [Limnobacter humi]MCQ8897500.1 hypothetical protein [Limnobacter humi]